MSHCILVYLTIFVVGIALHITLGGRPRTKKRVLEIILIYYLAVWIGLMGIMGFMGHAFMSDKVAAFIGWPAGNPFQFEIAVANLSYGILGLLCIWFRGNFWIATGVGQAVFMWGAAYGHIQQIIVHDNYAPGNAGLILYLDILIPIIFFGLLIAYRTAREPTPQ